MKMTKPLNEFGGWLSFFNVIFWFRLLFWISIGGATLITLVKTSSTSIEFKLIHILESVVFIFLNLQLIKIVKKQDLEVPNQMLRLTFNYIYLTFFFYLAEAGIAYLLYSKSFSLSSLYDSNSFPNLGLLATFMTYLNTSKRVKEFYGINASYETLRIRFGKR